MARSDNWAMQNPHLLREEITEINASFPTFIAALGRRLSEDRCWVEAAEPVLCRRCSELMVFDRGVRCAACGEPASAPQEDAAVGVVGRIPALISGRPFERALSRRMARLRERGDPRVRLLDDSLIEVGGRKYLAPRFGLWFARSWPHADPPVMVWPEYFDVLNIPPDHIYHADQYFRLCLYANWREQSACNVLQNRVVPRLLIDLMVADLVAVGRLDQALQSLDASLYELYNVVGRPAQVEPFKRIYDELVTP